MRRLLLAALATVSLAASIGMPAHAAAAAPRPKVAIIVGPVGSLTPTYLHLAELAAAEATAHGAIVAKAYSPNATPANVLAAVEGAHVVVYFGHGYGHPSPYGGLNAARQNGWGLQGPRAHGTHGDSLNGELAYYGEDWIVANARPAPGFVMVYSNTCYAPGASEGGYAPATESVALQRVAHYSRKVFRMGGSAYFATDFDRGAADLLRRLLGGRHATYGAHFAGDARYVPSALRAYGHPFAAGAQVWLHRTRYTDGPPNYWYAFAGNPAATPARSWDPVAPEIALEGAAAGLGAGAAVRLRLSEETTGIGPATVLLTDASGAAVPADVRVDEARNQVTVRPERPLSLSAHYRLSVAAGVTDLAGNPLATASWRLATRLDADPTDDALTVRLGAGSHELIRIDAAGAATETRSLTVNDERWVSAERRARLPGRDGSWLELATGDLGGWWVAESSVAHVPGLLDRARYGQQPVVTLPVSEYTLYTVDRGSLAQAGELAVRTPRSLAVDARVVADGQLLVRVAGADPALAGRWIPIRRADAPDESLAARLLGEERRDVAAGLRLGLGDWTVFRFDDGGRVLDRRTVAGSATPALAVERSIDVGGAVFHVVTGGDLDGWAVRASAAHTLLPGEVRAASAE